MSYNLKVSAAAILSGAVLLSGCASTGQSPTMTTPQNNQNYAFPSEITDGYWAATTPIDGEAVVVKFSKEVTTNYHFDCNTNGSYRQVDENKYTLIPSKTGMGLKFEDESVFSELSVVRLAPKQVLILNQSFTNPEIQRAMPDGLEFAYIYMSTLKPICP